MRFPKSGPKRLYASGDRPIAEGVAEISRKDFGLTYNSILEGGGVMIGDEVEISLEVELVKTA